LGEVHKWTFAYRTYIPKPVMSRRRTAPGCQPGEHPRRCGTSDGGTEMAEAGDDDSEAA